MKNSPLALALFFASFIANSVSNAHAISFSQALALLNQNEQWQRALNQVLLSETDVDIVQSGMFPNISFQASYLKQDETSTSLLGSEQRQSFFNLTQPLFQGFKEFRLKKSAQLTVKARKAVANATQRELVFNLSQIYFGILQAQKEVELLQESFNIAKEVEKEINQRQRIGRSRKSEALSAKAQALKSKSQMEQAQTQLENLKIRFWRFLGEEPKKEKTSFAAPASDFVLEDVEKIYSNHPAIAAAKIMLEASQEMVKAQRSDHYPNLGLSANYYLEQEGTFNRPDWSASLHLNFPIYEGGATTSQVYRAKLMKKEADLDLTRAKRNLKETLNNLKVQYDQGKNRLKTLKASVDMSLKNYRELRRENRLGLITSLEVMTGLDQYIQEKRAYNQTRLSLLNYERQLGALAGEFN